jgi:ABC-type lipoprotein release transport system permease subunit
MYLANSIKRQGSRGGRGQLFATITLAFWQLRLTWRLLLLVGSGVMAAVILVCMVPLYSDIALTAGLRDALTASNVATVTIHSEAHLISQRATQQAGAQIQQNLQQNIGPFLAGSQFSVQSPGLQVGASNQIQLIGWSLPDASKHVRLLAGSLPPATGSSLEIAITPETAQALNLRVDSTVHSSMPFLNAAGNQILYPLTFHVVGIFLPVAPGESFWHGTSFVSQPLGPQGNIYPSLVSNNSYLAALDAASVRVSGGNAEDGTSFSVSTDLFWYYNLATSHLNINGLNELNNGLNNVLVSITNQPVDEPFVDKTSSSGPSDLLDDYASRISVVSIPLLSLSYLIAGLMLFFVILMMDLLVDRQSEAIAVLRSRGASQQQVFGSLIVQSIGVGIVALLGGPLLSLLLASLLARFSLPAHDLGALNIILADPLSAALNLYLSAVVTVVVSLLAMTIAVYRASRLNVLALHRETARSSRGPAWLRMGLDLLAGVIALTGYAFSLYIASPGVLDTRTRILLLPPLTLVGSVFLLLACMLLFLRIFPLILTGLSLLAARARGATSLLAVAQMARVPRQSLRMTLLLALAVAFGIFTLIFSTSQAERVPNAAAYQVGADFNGTYLSGAALSKQPLDKQEAAFASLAGVESVSVGYVSSTRGSTNGADAPIELRAVDARNFAHTAIWDGQDASQPLSFYMRQLSQASSQNPAVVPAVVDEAAWQSLDLSPGSSFTLSDLNGDINYQVVGEVAHIPTIEDSNEASGTNDYVPIGGVLVDFQAYQAAVQLTSQLTIEPSTVWLKTRDDAATLTRVRNALSAGPLSLSNINDRRALVAEMGSDPLYLALIGVLIVGTTTALLLGLLGNLVVSWLSARSRFVVFGIMRALGTAPGQLARILTYEQIVIYATSLGLGMAFGILLAYLVLPAFVFTSAAGNVTSGVGEFYVIQNVPPVQTIIPVLAIGLAVGILVAVCVVIIGIMVRVVSRPALSSVLRLNGD